MLPRLREGRGPADDEPRGVRRKLLNQTDFTIEKTQKRDDGTRHQVYDGVTLTPRGEELLASGPTADEGDGQQSAMGGPRKRKDRVVDLAGEYLDEDSGVSHDMLVGLAVGEGMTPDQAEAAIAKARNMADLAGTEEYYPT